MAIGAVLHAPDGSNHEISERLAGTGCCNEAEAVALERALQKARLLGAKAISIRLDSTLLRDELTTPQRTKNIRLQTAYEATRRALAMFDNYHIEWKPRRHNERADALARRALLGCTEQGSATLEQQA